MDISKIAIGRNVPHDVNVIIEIPMGGQPVKYEMDKNSGALIVDRFWQTSMVYPANYGFIPHTLSKDGDPCDALVLGPAVVSSAIVRCRPVGALMMQDESGDDEKIIMVPANDASPYYSEIKSYKDLPHGFCDQVTHFFQHYKDLEKGKWVKITKWVEAEEAFSIINDAIKRAGS